MQTKELARQLLELIGGRDNLITVTHCATRLRMVLHDHKKANKEAIEDLEGVKGVFYSSGQFQVILGTGLVNKVYEEFVEVSGINTEKTSVDANQVIKEKMNPVARLARTLSNIFVPLIPAIVASGLLMGLLGMLKAFHWVSPESPLLRLLDMFSSAAFIILPILIGFSAAKEFGGNPYLGAVIGGIMTHPALLNPWTLGTQKPEAMNLFGLQIDLVGYQGTVIPVLLSVYIMSFIEKRLRKVVPNVLDLIVTPFLTVMFVGFIALVAVGPLGMMLGDAIAATLNVIYAKANFFAGLIFGGLYSSIVITGVHHSFHAIEASLLANPSIGVNFLLPIWSMANVAQGGAGLAVFFLTQDQKMKGIALPAAFTSFLGITEPVIYGVNLKLGKPFIGAAIGGALGSAYVVATHVVANAYGLTGIPMIAIVAPLGMGNLVNYLIGFVIAVISAFVASLLLGIQENKKQA